MNEPEWALVGAWGGTWACVQVLFDAWDMCEGAALLVKVQRE